ncbi:sugar transferase [Cryobacterium inferilacus]|uniref:sugar transferase n=1 Tax=Cryobacterium inferilacus TaxID=2866629 RepID=UPI0021028A48|nr:sugar transferase [Cryobacterium sp. 1639]
MARIADAKEIKELNRNWRDVYAARLVLTDLLVLVWVVFGVQILWFGLSAADLRFRGSLTELAISYTAISVTIITAWMFMLGIYGSRGYRVLGTGPQEYRKIADATVRLFGLVAIISFLFQIDFARGYILIAFPLGLIVLIFSRWIWRIWLGAQRLDGEYSSRVILVGSQASAEHLARELTRQSAAGYLVVGACIPGLNGLDSILNNKIPVFPDVDRLQESMELVGADTVVVTSSDDLSPQRLRELSWSLEPGKQHLVVAPSLTDIGGPRIHTRPVAGLPLIHVETPRYEGGRRFAKRAFDLIGGGAMLLILSPFLAVITVAIRLSTPGQVLFRQQRVGINGERFEMLKFRSMVVDAESRLETLRGLERAEGNTVMFKMKNDPRVTPIGGFLRRYSLDELPQLFNVIGGSMSLVGPRPPLEREVNEYENHVHRRFLVKPGITGLWQVSGRSNLSWADTVRLDLYYVENWSITGDLAILWRTAQAVLRREGAY